MFSATELSIIMVPRPENGRRISYKIQLVVRGKRKKFISNKI